MPDPNPVIRFIKDLLGLFLSTSIQGAVCLTIGGALTYVGLLLGCSARQSTFLLFTGMAIPLWPLRVYYSPERILERKFREWDRWVERGMLTKAECRAWKNEMKGWYRSQISGKPEAMLPALEHELVEDHGDDSDTD